VPACDAKAGHCDDRSDDVAAPVDDIEDGALDRGRLLALNGLAELRTCSEVLSLAAKGAMRLPRSMKLKAIFSAMCSQLISADGGVRAWRM